MKRHVLLLLILLTGTTYLSARKDARITDFHSEIEILPDGMITVKETITVYADGYDIQRGIVRTLPTVREDINGKAISTPFSILSVKRDGNPEKYKTESLKRAVDIYIGDGNTFLDPGLYEYEILYEVKGQIGFFDEYDELYWNVTGTDWVFPIEEAAAVIKLPEGGTSINTACYTGAYGTSKGDCKVEGTESRIMFRTSRSLKQKEGLTVAVSFTPGLVKRPPPPTQAEIFWHENKQMICYTLSIVIMLLFYIITWIKVGVDPEKQIAIPDFKPPHGWSPAALRYIYKRGYDNKTFTTALVSMAVKGTIRIRQQKRKYTLDLQTNQGVLPNEEAEVLFKIFEDGSPIEVSGDHYSTFSGAATRLKNALKKLMSIKDYYLKNIGYIVFAAILGIILILVSLYHGAPTDSLFIFIVILPFLFSGVSTMAAAIRQRSFIRIFSFLSGAIFAGVALYTQFIFLPIYDLPTIIFLAVMFIAFGLYVYLIKAPTELGAKTYAEIEGFKMYLKTAEKDRLNTLTPPEQTPQLFEELLPYAIALDVENEWGKKFDEVLKLANYEPKWYEGTTPFHPTTFGHSFSNSFDSSLQRAQHNPNASSGSGGGGSWSSGSSGGGFSGGGGGGGGGRGW